jgi:hypothetical protein
MDFLRQKRFAAFGAHHDGIEHLAALAVLMQQGPSAFVDHVGVAPMHERHHHWIEIEALLGEDVFVPLGRFLIGNAAQHALPDQLLQPFGEQMAGDPERGLKSLKPARAQEALAQDQKAPAVADHTDGAGHRTWLFLKFVPLHSCSPVVRGCSARIEQGTPSGLPF